jgi:hypothetical protein
VKNGEKVQGTFVPRSAGSKMSASVAAPMDMTALELAETMRK